MKSNFYFKKFFLLSLFLLFSSKNVYSKSESEKVNEKKDIVGNFFSYLKSEFPGFKLPKNLYIAGSLDVKNNQALGGNLTIMGDINADGNIYLAGDFSIGGTLNLSSNLDIVSNLICSDLKIENDFNANGNINLNTNSSSGKINIGGSNSGSINIDSGEGIFIGSNSNCPINFGSVANTLNINLVANKNSGTIKIVGKSLIYDVTEIQKPAKGYYKYLAVDTNGKILTINTSVGGDSLDIDNLTVNKNTNLYGNVSINSNAVGQTNISGQSISIGKTNVQDLGIYGKKIQIGSDGVLVLGYIDELSGGAIQITGSNVTINGSDLFFDFNSIKKPMDETSFNYLVINKDGKVSSLENFDSGEDLDGNFETLLIKNNLTVLGNISVGGNDLSQINIGNEKTGDINLKSNNSLKIDSPKLSIFGKNLSLNFSSLTLPTSGTSYLKVNSSGNVTLENTLTDNQDNLTFGSVKIKNSLDVNGDVTINSSGSNYTKIGADNYAGNITIGNENCSGLKINGGQGNLEIGKNSVGTINIGSSSTPLISINTTDSGQVVLYGNSLFLDLNDLTYPSSLDSEGTYYLYVDSDKKLRSKKGILIENQSIIKNLNVSDSANLNGEVYINKDSLTGSKTVINGKVIDLGTLSTSDFNILSKNSILASENVTFMAPGDGTLNGKIEIIGGDVLLQGNSLNFNFSDINVAAEGDLNYLVIDSFGKISSIPANRASSNYQYYGNFYINSNQGGTTQIGNTVSGGEVKIYSIEDINLTGKNIKIDTNENIVLISSGIEAPSAGNFLPLKINSNNEVVTDVSAKRFKKNIKNLAVSRKAIMNLIFKQFNYREDGTFDFGLIAEDLIGTEFEKAIIFDKEGKPLSINYRMIFSAIFSDYLMAFKELEVLRERQNEIEELLQKVCKIYSVNEN